VYKQDVSQLNEHDRLVEHSQEWATVNP
jgi:hypothetical protein